MSKLPFQHMLSEQCSGIVQKVLEGMLPNRFHVGLIKLVVVPHEAILYRWWFPKNSPVMKVMADFAKHDKALAALLKQAETCKIEGRTYYSLYFGKSNNGYRRYNQHTIGNVHLSTLRQTIYGLCVGNQYDPAKEKDVSDILSQCYYEWTTLPGEEELVECMESICIALGKYPLNLDGNPAISNEWREELMMKRKLKNKLHNL